MSLTAQRNLNKSQTSLATSIQRLSSGLRINSAKDDAAGLSISERMTSQIRGLNQAIRNANDGISFAQTAEGSLSTMGDALQRIRELAVQSVNDTNSSSDRGALNNELQQLVAEVNRIASATQFNGQNMLDGTLSTLTFQVGANQNQTIQVDGVDARGSQLGARVPRHKLSW
jgi:flagellin